VRTTICSFAEVSLALVLSVALTGPQAGAASSPSTFLGVVSAADHASCETKPIVAGTAILDGDKLLTGTSGSLQARLGRSQISMLSNSNVMFHRLSNGEGALLAEGTIVFSTSGVESFQVLADGVTIQPIAGRPTIAQVSRVNAEELMLTCERGSLLVVLGDQEKVVGEGTSYRVMIQPSKRSAGQPTAHAGRSYFYIVLIAVAYTGAGIAAGYALSSATSPSAP